MPRPVQRPRSGAFTGDDLEAYETLIDRFRRGSTAPSDEIELMPYFGALVNAPRLAAVLGRLGTLVRAAGDREGTYSHRDRELVDQVLSPHLGTNVVLKTHIPDGLAVGIPLESIEALRRGRDEELGADDRLLARYVRQVIDGTVDDETWEAMERRLGRRGLVEYTIFIALLQLIMRLYQAFGLVDPPDEENDRLLEEFRSGARELPDFRERII
jgi:hypothetical protein